MNLQTRYYHSNRVKIRFFYIEYVGTIEIGKHFSGVKLCTTKSIEYRIFFISFAQLLILQVFAKCRLQTFSLLYRPSVYFFCLFVLLFLYLTVTSVLWTVLPFIDIYWVPHKLPQIYTTNHATFPIQIHKITVQICGNFWGTQYNKQ